MKRYDIDEDGAEYPHQDGDWIKADGIIEKEVYILLQKGDVIKKGDEVFVLLEGWEELKAPRIGKKFNGLVAVRRKTTVLIPKGE